MNKKIIKKVSLIIVVFSLGVVVTIMLSTSAAENLASSNVGYDNTNSGSSKTNIKDAIDDLYEKAETRCPNGKECLEKCAGNNCKCKRATTLHTETCNNSSAAYYCQGDGYASGATVTYGSLGTSGTLTSGDAFDCDVNGDGIYDAETERFYYVSDYYDTSSQTLNSNYAVLIYYNNVLSGSSSNSNYAYNSSGSNINGPVTAITQLPTTTQWSNVSLLKTTRAIITETGTASTTAGSLPTNFSYVGYAARLLTVQEVNVGCSVTTVGNYKTGELSDKCKYLFENTKYTNSSNVTYGPWLENPNSTYSGFALYVSAIFRQRKSYSDGNDAVNLATYHGVRPAIEVLKSDIDY